MRVLSGPNGLRTIRNTFVSRMPGGVDLILFLCSAYCSFLDLASDGDFSVVLDLIDDPGDCRCRSWLPTCQRRGKSPARLSATVQRQGCFFEVGVPVPIVVCDHFVWPRGGDRQHLL
jgi:hypothetical protein